MPREGFARVPDIIPELFDMIARGAVKIDTVMRPLDRVTEAWNEPVSSGARVVLAP